MFWKSWPIDWIPVWLIDLEICVSFMAPFLPFRINVSFSLPRFWCTDTSWWLRMDFLYYNISQPCTSRTIWRAWKIKTNKQQTTTTTTWYPVPRHSELIGLRLTWGLNVFFKAPHSSQPPRLPLLNPTYWYLHPSIALLLPHYAKGCSMLLIK